jgi:hypothetical protein
LYLMDAASPPPHARLLQAPVFVGQIFYGKIQKIFNLISFDPEITKHKDSSDSC